MFSSQFQNVAKVKNEYKNKTCSVTRYVQKHAVTQQRNAAAAETTDHNKSTKFKHCKVLKFFLSTIRSMLDTYIFAQVYPQPQIAKYPKGR